MDRKRRTKRLDTVTDKTIQMAAAFIQRNVGVKVGLSDEELDRAARVLRHGAVTKQTLQKIDTRGKAYLILSGRVNIINPSSGLIDATLERGTVFGEAPDMGLTMLGCSAQAENNVELVLTGPTLEDAYPSGALAAEVAKSAAAAKNELYDALFRPVVSRVARFLLAEKANGVVKGHSHASIALRLGAYRETVTNALGELRRKKAIRVGRQKIEILDAAELARVAGV